MKITIGLLALPLLTNSLFAQAAVVGQEFILAKEIPPLPSGEKFKAVIKFSGEMKMNMVGEFEAQPSMNAKMTMNSSMKIDLRTSQGDWPGSVFSRQVLGNQ